MDAGVLISCGTAQGGIRSSVNSMTECGASVGGKIPFEVLHSSKNRQGETRMWRSLYWLFP